MSGATQWSVLDAGTRASGTYNDDAFGFSAKALWVLDGATGISDVRFTGHASDAAWLAETASTLLGALDDGPIEAVLEQLQERVKSAFAELVAPRDPSALEALDMPCACLGLARLHDGVLELACVGDISIIVAPPGGPLQVFSDQASASFADKTLAHWRELLQSHGDPASAWPQLRPTIRANRAAVNRPGGYTVIHPTRDWTHLVKVHRLDCETGTRVLLASDGAWRMVDLFGVHDPASLLETVARAGWGPVLDALRQIETQDQDCARFLRVKPCDDATGLLARVDGAPA